MNRIGERKNDYSNPVFKKSVIILCVYLFNVGSVQAAITFNVNDYSLGTDVTNIIPNVTIEYYNHTIPDNYLTYRSATIGSVCDEFGSAGCMKELSLYGENAEYYAVINNTYNFLSEAGPFSGLSLTFDQAVNNFELAAFSFSGDVLDLFLFDESGNHLNTLLFAGETAPSCPYGTGDGPCFNYLLNTDFIGNGVYQVFIGSDSAAIYLNDFSASTVPIPATVWLFCSGLIGLIGINRRRVS